MKKYIGTKVVQAEPCYRRRGNLQEIGYRVCYADGYESWSPKDVFDAAYRPTSGMNFGLAIEAAKQGKRIARAGWNGKKQYVELATCISYKNTAGEVVNVEHSNIGNSALAFVGTSGVQLGWLASQADMLADDWYIVESAADKGTDEAERNKILDFCIQVTKITDAEVQEVREIAQSQMEYHNPLRMATTARQNELGRYNQAVLDALLNLKAVIESGESI